MLDDAGFFIELPTVVKAKQDGDRRMVEITASKQVIDDEGDLILQSALLDAGPAFCRNGVLDKEHISEIGYRFGVSNPTDYVVGNPIEVRDFGDGATGVIGELQRGRLHADEIWTGLNASPPVRWQASIYGFPTPNGLLDARVTKAEDMMGAKRYLVKAIDWRSLAFTMHPICASVDAARVYTAKAYVEVMKSRFPGAASVSKMENYAQVEPINYILPPRNREELMGHLMYHMRKGRCPAVNQETGASVDNFRRHFSTCCGESEWDADIKALALMHLLKREKSTNYR